MNKKIIFTLLIILSFFFVCCNKTEKDGEKTEQNTEIKEVESVSIHEIERKSHIKEQPEWLFLAKINDDSVRLRTESNLNCETVLLLNLDDKVTVLEETEDLTLIAGEEFKWYKVEVNSEPKRKGWVYGKYITRLIETKYNDSDISPNALNECGFTQINNFTEIFQHLTQHQIDSISKIFVNDMKIKSFEGIEKFRNIQTLVLENCTFVNFENIVLNSNYEDFWLYVKSCKVENTKGLKTISSLVLLDFDSSTVKNFDCKQLPSQLHTIYFSNFSQYTTFLTQLPQNISGIGLTNNNISDLSALRFLLKIYPNLSSVDVTQNGMDWQYLKKEAENWDGKLYYFEE